MRLIFFICGFIAIGFVLVITIYLIISGIPAIREIGLVNFLFGTEWASTAEEPKFGILPMILTSVYGTAGRHRHRRAHRLPHGRVPGQGGPPEVAAVIRPVVELLAGIPSVVYGLVGMMVLVPWIRTTFNLPPATASLPPSSCWR